MDSVLSAFKGAVARLPNLFFNNANCASLFAMELGKLLVNDQNAASC